jgi:plastocyanin
VHADSVCCMFRHIAPRATLVSCALVASVALVGCGGGGDSEPAPSVEADLVVTAVPTIRWDADAYTASAGEVTVALRNEDSVRHTLVVLKDKDVVGDLELAVNRRGDVDTGSITLEAGTYRIFCTVPGHQNMNSELVVS